MTNIGAILFQALSWLGHILFQVLLVIGRVEIFFLRKIASIIWPPIRWLNQHWEWYFVIIVTWYVYYLTNHVPDAKYVFFGLVLFVIPSPVVMLWVFIIAAVKRVQIFKRIYGWALYALFLTFLIRAEPTGETLSEVYALRLQEAQGDPRAAVAWYCFIGIIAVAPLGLFWWTRYARLHPRSHKWDIVSEEESAKQSRT